MTTSALISQVATQLQNSKFLVPTHVWLDSFLSSQKTTTSLPALVSTASFRLLSSDITTSLQPVESGCFPSDILNGTIKERRIVGPIVVQILDVEDMSRSRWEQIEAIEALERGEGTKGREIIRVTAPETGNASGVSLSKHGGPHKLLLQDTNGLKIYGMELKGVEGLGLSMNIGSKLILRNATVARAVALLEPATTTFIGGKIETLNKDWRENRKARLRAAIEVDERLSAEVQNY